MDDLPPESESVKMLFDDDSTDEEKSYSCHEFSDNMEEEDQREDYEDLVFKDPAIGDYVLVKFLGKREPKYFVGLVEGVEEFWKFCI